MRKSLRLWILLGIDNLKKKPFQSSFLSVQRSIALPTPTLYAEKKLF